MFAVAERGERLRLAAVMLARKFEFISEAMRPLRRVLLF